MYEPPQISDFDSDAEAYQRCLDAYTLGYLHAGDGRKQKCPYEGNPDELWWYTRAYKDYTENGRQA